MHNIATIVAETEKLREPYPHAKDDQRENGRDDCSRPFTASQASNCED
jgi:hypothetical protein